MKTNAFHSVLISFLLSVVAAAHGDHHGSPFSEPTIDLGCVVSDLDAAVEFYTEAIGFQEAGGFQVDGDYAKEVGLTDGKALDIKVLTLGEGEEATRLKFMEAGGRSRKVKNDHITTSLGFSYITIFVKSTDEAMARLEKAGVKPIANSPKALPANLNPEMALTIVRDPDGNFVELVGPKPGS
ncbi:MAG TPA: bleomycin resistance protein [Opitutae bacterium]|nr:bleomycin resistance protein [Myxococcales bacterium]HCR30967.1 bleomycin resistance protein [Opitutae bacterium]